MSAKLDIVKTFLDELGCGSLDKALGFLTDDAKWAIVQTNRGATLAKSELGARLQMMRSSFKDNKLVLTQIGCIEEGNRLSVEAESLAETILDATYRNKYCIIFTFSGDKISDVREYNDSLHLMEVLAPAIAARA